MLVLYNLEMLYNLYNFNGRVIFLSFYFQPQSKLQEIYQLIYSQLLQYVIFAVNLLILIQQWKVCTYYHINNQNSRLYSALCYAYCVHQPSRS